MIVPEEHIGLITEEDLVVSAAQIRGYAREIRRCLDHEGDASECAKHIEAAAAQLIARAVRYHSS